MQKYSCSFVELNKYYLETVETYGEKRHKNRGKINTGIVECVVGGSCIVCGLADIAVGTPPSIAAGIVFVGVGCAATAVGVCEIQDGQEGHKETVLESRETFLRTKDTEKEANQATKMVENDTKQIQAVEKRNIKQEKEIDKILKDAEEQSQKAQEQEAA